jgi:hypothetical protein
MKAPLILSLLFLLAPVLPAASTLLDDGPPGFLHLQKLDDDDPTNVATDTYLRISTISAVTILTDKKNQKAPYTVRIQSYAMRYTFGERVEPLAFHLEFTKKEDAENLMLKITRLVTEAK